MSVNGPLALPNWLCWHNTAESYYKYGPKPHFFVFLWSFYFLDYSKPTIPHMGPVRDYIGWPLSPKLISFDYFVFIYSYISFHLQCKALGSSELTWHYTTCRPSSKGTVRGWTDYKRLTPTVWTFRKKYCYSKCHLMLTFKRTSCPQTLSTKVRFSQASVVTAFICLLPFPGNIHELVSTGQLSQID